MSQNFTLYVYKTDRRYKSDERIVRTEVVTDTTEKQMAKKVADLAEFDGPYPTWKGYRMEYHPTTITVKSLMTGKDVQIDRDTPWCCNPASESFWSN
jgi:hypothetical protein